MTKRFIDKYEIVSTLGRGSMGVVYKGRDPEIGRLVAIKTLKSVFMGDDPAGSEAMQRFRQESRSAGKLHHANIVTIFEAGKTENGSPYIVMEYIDGKSLESLVSERGPLPVLEVLHYLAQMGSAIDYAHSQNVIHRDIKPSNIIVDDRYRPHLLDFGVAKLSDTSLTPAGTVVGTPSYMSPEQIRGSTLDGRTDLFSLAVVAFELLTGVRPFPGNDFTTVVSNIIHKPPLPFRELKVSLPAELEQVLARALSKNREERYQSVLQFVDAMAQIFSVVVDGAGIVGGFEPALTIEEAAARSSRLSSKPVGAGAEPGPSTGVAAAAPQSGLVNGASHSPVSSSTPTGSGAAPAAAGASAVTGSGGFTKQVQFGGISALTGDDDAASTITMAKSEVLSSLAARQSQASPQEGLGMKAVGILGIAVISVIGTLVWMLSDTGREGEAVVVEPPQEASVFPADDPAPGNEIANAAPGDVAVVETAHEPPPAPVIEISPEQITPEYLAGVPSAALAELLKKDLEINQLRVVITAASGHNDPAVIDGLVARLSHPQFVIRVEAMKSLAKSAAIQEAKVFDPIIARLDDTDELVRGFAAKTLTAVQAPRALAAMERRVQVEKSEIVRKVLQQSIREKKRQ